MAKTSFIASGNLNSNCRWKYKIDGLFIESESIQDNCLKPYFFFAGEAVHNIRDPSSYATTSY